MDTPDQHPADCPGTLTKWPNRDRAITDPASLYKWTCDANDDHVYEDPDTMPRDRSRTFGER